MGRVRGSTAMDRPAVSGNPNAAGGAVLFFIPLEKDKSGIVVQDPFLFSRVLLQVVADSWHGGLFTGHLVFIHQKFADTFVFTAIGRSKLNGPQGTITETDLSRALDVKDKGVHRVFQIYQLTSCQQFSIFYLCPGPEGDFLALWISAGLLFFFLLQDPDR